MQFERLGCFYIEHKRITSLENHGKLVEPYKQRPSPVQACASEALSRGLKKFAVYDGGECLGDWNISAILPRLNASKECFGGRGGPNATDVYRFTSKETWIQFSANMFTLCLHLFARLFACVCWFLSLFRGNMWEVRKRFHLYYQSL